MSLNKKYVLFIFLVFCLSETCTKDDYLEKWGDVRLIKVSDRIKVDNTITVHDPVFNYYTYEQFLQFLVESGRFLVVPQKDFDKTYSDDKIVLSLRHDVDDNINSAVKIANREHEYGISSTFFFLHTASYYGKTKVGSFNRSDLLIDYLIFIQNSLNHEIGFHNDLVTLQVVYDIKPKNFLHEELDWMRKNGIKVSGSVAHGSPYCYIYHYLNSYFWQGFEKDEKFIHWNVLEKNSKLIVLEKANMSDYSLDYEGYDLKWDYYFSDSNNFNGKQWNFGMIDWDTIKPGKKVIFVLHPQYYD